ncbi:MAG: glycosyltransferase family 2 protein [bacterium]
MKVFCIIPAYNEARNIGQVITAVQLYVDQVIVVDDCSLDETVATAKQTQAVVLQHVLNRDQGGALTTGTAYALSQASSDHDIIIHFDADGQMRAQDIPTVIAPLQARQADVVFGSRFLDQSTKMPWFKKYIIMNLARLVNRTMGVKLTDPQSGFRAMTVAVAKQLSWQDGKSHASEILVAVHLAHYRIVEVPITVLYHRFGLSLGNGFKIIKDIFIGKLIK